MWHARGCACARTRCIVQAASTEETRRPSDRSHTRTADDCSTWHTKPSHPMLTRCVVAEPPTRPPPPPTCASSPSPTHTPTPPVRPPPMARSLPREVPAKRSCCDGSQRNRTASGGSPTHARGRSSGAPSSPSPPAKHPRGGAPAPPCALRSGGGTVGPDLELPMMTLQGVSKANLRPVWPVDAARVRCRVQHRVVHAVDGFPAGI